MKDHAERPTYGRTDDHERRCSRRRTGVVVPCRRQISTWFDLRPLRAVALRHRNGNDEQPRRRLRHGARRLRACSRAAWSIARPIATETVALRNSPQRGLPTVSTTVAQAITDFSSPEHDAMLPSTPPLPMLSMMHSKALISPSLFEPQPQALTLAINSSSNSAFARV